MEVEEAGDIAQSNGQGDMAANIPPSKAFQDMVNEALESKLQGFQSQMQQMLSLIQGTAVLPSTEPQPAAAPAIKTEPTEPTSVTPQDLPTEGESQNRQGTAGAAAEGETGTETVKETGAQRRRRIQVERRQRYLDEVAMLEQEQKEFRQFLETIAPLLNLPLPAEEMAENDGGTKKSEAVVDDPTLPSEGETADDTAPGEDTVPEGDTIPGDDTATKDDTATAEDTAPRDDIVPKDDIPPGDETEPMDDTVPRDEALPEDTTRKVPPVLRFPADEIVRGSWAKIEGKQLTTAPFHMKDKICYRWPLEDKDTFGRVPAVNPEVSAHLNVLNNGLNRKNFAGLPGDRSRVNLAIKEMEQMFRYQQRVHSYASYLLQALGKHISGEVTLDEETSSGLLGYLGKSLSDVCDTSVRGCMAATKLRRRMYIDSMDIETPGNAQYVVLNRPLSKELFPPDLKETYANHNINLITSGTRKRGPPRQGDNPPEEGDAPRKRKRPRKKMAGPGATGAEVSKPVGSAPQQRTPKQNISPRGQGGLQQGRSQRGKRQAGAPPGRGRQLQAPRQSPLLSQRDNQAFGRSTGMNNRGGQRDTQFQMGGGQQRPTGMGMSKTAQRRRRGRRNDTSSSSQGYGGSSGYTPGREEYVGSALLTSKTPSSYGYGQSQNAIRYRYDDTPVSSFGNLSTSNYSTSNYSSPSYQDFSRQVSSPSYQDFSRQVPDYSATPKYSRSSYQDFSRP